MTTFDDIDRNRTSRLGSDRVAFFNGKYSRQQAVPLAGRLGVYLVDCSHSRIVLDLEGGGRMFAGSEMLEIRIDERCGGLIFPEKRTLIAIDEKN